jgi:hypothetical protein
VLAAVSLDRVLPGRGAHARGASELVGGRTGDVS